MTAWTKKKEEKVRQFDDEEKVMSNKRWNVYAKELFSKEEDAEEDRTKE